MAGRVHVITGATGLLGSHLAERLTRYPMRFVPVLSPVVGTSDLSRFAESLTAR